jgi:hypothetical protein
MNIRTKIEGSLYAMHNELFNTYGPHYYKLGRSKDLRKRIRTYQTSYIEPSFFVSVSCRRFKDSDQAETLLFYLLRRFRVKNNREFFTAPLCLIRHMMLRVSALSDDMIEKIVTLIDRQTKYSDVSKYNTNEEIDDLISHFEESCKVKTDMTKQPHWREEFDEFLDDFFNKFRFKPKEEDVDKYKKYGYKPVEDLELNGLLDQSRLL